MQAKTKENEAIERIRAKGDGVIQELSQGETLPDGHQGTLLQSDIDGQRVAFSWEAENHSTARGIITPILNEVNNAQNQIKQQAEAFVDRATQQLPARSASQEKTQLQQTIEQLTDDAYSKNINFSVPEKDILGGIVETLKAADPQKAAAQLKKVAMIREELAQYGNQAGSPLVIEAVKSFNTALSGGVKPQTKPGHQH